MDSLKEASCSFEWKQACSRPDQKSCETRFPSRKKTCCVWEILPTQIVIQTEMPIPSPAFTSRLKSKDCLFGICGIELPGLCKPYEASLNVHLGSNDMGTSQNDAPSFTKHTFCQLPPRCRIGCRCQMDLYLPSSSNKIKSTLNSYFVYFEFAFMDHLNSMNKLLSKRTNKYLRRTAAQRQEWKLGQLRFQVWESIQSEQQKKNTKNTKGDCCACWIFLSIWSRSSYRPAI